MRIGYARMPTCRFTRPFRNPGFGRPDSPKGIAEGITAKKAKRYYEETPCKSLTCKGL